MLKLSGVRLFVKELVVLIVSVFNYNHIQKYNAKRTQQNCRTNIPNNSSIKIIRANREVTVHVIKTSGRSLKPTSAVTVELKT